MLDYTYAFDGKNRLDKTPNEDDLNLMLQAFLTRLLALDGLLLPIPAEEGV